MKSALLLVALVALVLTSQVYSSVSHAEACEVTTDDGYTRLFVGTGAAKRSPTMEEVFDGMNAKDSTLFEDLKFVSGRADQPRVYVDVPKTPLYYDFRTLPSPAPNDSACKDKIQTGYDCRVNQLKSLPEAHGLPKGIKTGISIAVPQNETVLLGRIAKNLGCDELYDASGAPAVKTHRGKAVPLVSPGKGTGTKP
ncbi:hypothetical protein BH10BDE1_BH10BDE1_35800 [soil metagenome]